VAETVALAGQPPGFWLAQAREPLIAWLRHGPSFVSHAGAGAWLVGSGDHDPEANWLALHRVGADALAELAEGIEMLRARRLPGTIAAAAGMGDLVSRYGLTAGEPLRHEVIALAELPAEAATGPECRAVRTIAEYAHARRLLIRAMNYPPSFARETFTPELLAEPWITFWLASMAGDSASVLVTWRRSAIVYVLIMGTDPAYRRRGLGRALLLHALGAEQRAGGVYAHLVSSEMGAHLYRAVGFRRLADHPNWLLPAEGP
jgi:GNAT superfamily N-acetyltransferase